MLSEEMKLHELVKQFIQGTDRSKERAGEIEVLLDKLYPYDARFEDLVLALASYEPGGGPYMFDESALVKMCEQAIKELESE